MDRASRPVAHEPEPLAQVADVLLDLTSEWEGAHATASLSRVVQRAATLLGARWACVAVVRGRTVRAEATTSDDARTAVAVLSEHGTAALVEAVSGTTPLVVELEEAGSGSRWQPAAGDLRARLGVRRLVVLPVLRRRARRESAAIVVGSDQDADLNGRTVALGRVVATTLALLLDAQAALEDQRTLRRALEGDREVGVALGIVMATHRMTRSRALEVLCDESRASGRTLVEVAGAVAGSGAPPRSDR